VPIFEEKSPVGLQNLKNIFTDAPFHLYKGFASLIACHERIKLEKASLIRACRRGT
jgi:hypothetical protein